MKMHDVESNELGKGLRLCLFCCLADSSAHCFDDDLADLCLRTAKVLSSPAC